MWFGLAVVLASLWFSVFPVAGGLIHLLLAFAAISMLWHFISRRRTPTG
jgi:hypothetical protein